MKMLVVGMDGAHLGVFQRGWTPYIASLLEGREPANIKNDLVSRGWSEIALGRHGSLTEAMYDRPICDGSLSWTTSFKMTDAKGFGSTAKPIWQSLNEQGVSVGIMNLPTVSPAPEVDGFYVSGGGGGAAVVQKPTAELCYPREILDDLLQNEYIVDERFVQLVVDKKIATVGEIYSRLAYKNERRTECFKLLANKYDVDFGLIVYKSSSVLAETLLVPELYKAGQNTESEVGSDFISAAKEYYLKFDGEIRKLHEEFPECEIVFVSDHGTAATEFRVNPNEILRSIGMQEVSVNRKIVFNAVGMLKRLVPFKLKMMLKKSKSIMQSASEAHGFDPLVTKAFCRTVGDWSYGIYINDAERFGGPVQDSEINSMATKIVEEINSNSEALVHNIRASVASSVHKERTTCFPDILLEVPDGYLITQASDKFVSKFKLSDKETSMDAVKKGLTAALKSRFPLAISTGDIFSRDHEIRRDLTLVYDRVIESYKARL